MQEYLSERTDAVDRAGSFSFGVPTSTEPARQLILDVGSPFRATCFLTGILFFCDAGTCCNESAHGGAFTRDLQETIIVLDRALFSTSGAGRYVGVPNRIVNRGRTAW